MRVRCRLHLCVLFFCCPVLVFSQNDTGNVATSTTSAASNSDLITKRIEEYKKLEATATQRIAEIDKMLSPSKDLIAKRFGVSPEEYHFLKLQAENADAAKAYFKNLRDEMKKSYVTINDYFAGANAAILKNNLWYGNEENLVDEDVSFLGKLEDEITQHLDSLPNGAEMKALLAEKQQLLDKLAHPDEIVLYQLTRKDWFANRPDYMQAMQEGRSMPSAPEKNKP